MLRIAYRHVLRRFLTPSVPLETYDPTQGSALIVAPHQDDETLGCGGVIALKRRAGQPVTILFLMDGRRSHARLIDPDELSRLRHQEALEAAAQLGVDAVDVRFLDFPEGSLKQHVEEATGKIEAVLQELRPAEVFVTATDEPHKDHAAAGVAAIAAARRCGLDLELYEYPIWCWYHWPHVPLPLWSGTRRAIARWRYDLPRVLRNTRRMRFGLGIERDFTVRTPIGSVHAVKRAALEHHRSQVTRLRSTTRWATLSDVANGEFLELFFGAEERFRRHNTTAGASA